MNDLGILVSAYIVDLIIGDPRKIPHPVRVAGSAIEKVEKWLRGTMIKPVNGIQHPDSKSRPVESGAEGMMAAVLRERAAGVFLVILIVGTTFTFFSLVCRMVFNAETLPLYSYILLLILVYLVSSTIATRELLYSANMVIRTVRSGHTEMARRELGMIVGRDTQSLDKRSILRATVETLSENASDGIIAPLVYFAIGGLPLAMTYKVINTLDSMVGYKNERYLNFGWASARLDDIANFVPARITGSIIVVASFMVSVFQYIVHNRSKPDCTDQKQHGKQKASGFHPVSGTGALKIMLRDGGRHASPNSGIPEAAMAGALGVKLGGPSAYGGVVSEKPFIGDERQDSETFYLRASEIALTITKLISILGLFTALLILYVRTSVWS